MHRFNRFFHHLNLIGLSILGVMFILNTGACKRKGCMKDVPCVDNYNAKAEREGDCTGCTVFGAYNYCPEADDDNGQCLFVREFYSDVSDQGWIDVWVSDSADNSNISTLNYEGRLSSFPTLIPDCETSDSTLSIIRRPGEYYYEVETETGQLEWGWVIFREEVCRLLDVY